MIFVRHASPPPRTSGSGDVYWDGRCSSSSAPCDAFDRDVQRVAVQLGYRHLIIWSVSAADTSSAVTVSTVIRRTTGARPGPIILMHCGYPTTARALPAIISHDQARGVAMIGLDELLEP